MSTQLPRPATGKLRPYHSLNRFSTVPEFTHLADAKEAFSDDIAIFVTCLEFVEGFLTFESAKWTTPAAGEVYSQ